MQIQKESKAFIGIDVSKAKLDIYDSRTGEFSQIANSSGRIEKWLKKAALNESLAVVDMTGGYEAAAVNVLFAAGVPVHRAEGRRVKAFMKSRGKKAKTDRLDAYELACFGEKFCDELPRYQPTNNAIAPLVDRLIELKGYLQKERNRVQAPTIEGIVKKDVNSLIDVLELRVNELELLVLSHIKDCPELLKKYEILTAQIGVGDKCAIMILGILPEIGQLNRRQIAALSGLAPYARDSGTINGHRFTGRGRPGIKPMLFLVALNATRNDSDIKAFYEKLIKKGKPKMVAITACMRKIIIKLNAKIKFNAINSECCKIS